MSRVTRATKALQSAGVPFGIATYEYDSNATSIGLQAASALGEPPTLVLKTLMAVVDGKPVCVIIPSDRELSLKKLASIFSAKSAKMMKPADAERITGYSVGGISPFGQARNTPIAIEISALDNPYVYVNGGQRGLQLRLNPADVVKAASAIIADLAAH